MSRDLLAVMRQIQTVQEGIVATIDGEEIAVAKSWLFFPGADQNIEGGGFPSWRNEWTMLPQLRDISLAINRFTVHMQLLVAHADLSRAAEIATAFMAPTLHAFDVQDEAGNGGVSLGELVENQAIRGGTPTMGRVDLANRSVIAVDLYLDFELHTPVLFS